MSPIRTLTALSLVAILAVGPALAQTVQRGQATSPGQLRAQNRLPQPPSGGKPTGRPAAGAETQQQKDAEIRAKKASKICKGC